MAKSPTLALPVTELDALFDALGILDKVRDGRLTAEVIVNKSSPSWDYPGGVSEYVRHRNIHGYQVATTHRITAADGSVPHVHAKDLHIGDIVIRV